MVLRKSSEFAVVYFSFFCRFKMSSISGNILPSEERAVFFLMPSQQVVRIHGLDEVNLRKLKVEGMSRKLEQSFSVEEYFFNMKAALFKSCGLKAVLSMKLNVPYGKHVLGAPEKMTGTITVCIFWSFKFCVNLFSFSEVVLLIFVFFEQVDVSKGVVVEVNCFGSDAFPVCRKMQQGLKMFNDSVSCCGRCACVFDYLLSVCFSGIEGTGFVS